ncbi:unnamed protein product [Kluyveromyces dobzhanskii CBS 2104]|uniref:WGS project CCBQ000000000 data, contig MAT n=1 Tax=Kluyveromyces dobzhanskii CBS 2104 TaxID=1427455 RepID=A0A0A8L3U3_9SACH|nr:unnamed protein product [Kluyveromyces dobzhanskii CBS 2104]
MSIQRLRYAQEKQQALAKQSRREVAKLLSESKEQKAHYRVESLINDDIHIELLEILELYCELLHARVAIVNTITDEICLIESHDDDGINEATRAIVYASIHAPEIKELLQIKDLLGLKFGGEFIKAIVDSKIGVPDKVLKKCSPRLPEQDLVELYLREIARTYEVSYSGLDQPVVGENTEISEELKGNDNTSDTSGSDSEDSKPILAVDNDEPGDDKHPIIIKKPRQNSETITEEFKIPKDIVKDIKVSHSKAKTNSKDSIDDLRKRFEALRR